MFQLDCVFGAVFTRSAACVFLKNSGKVTLGGKTQVVADGSQGFIRIAEEAFGLLCFFFQNEIRKAFTGFFDKFPGEIGTAEIKLFCNVFCGNRLR